MKNSTLGGRDIKQIHLRRKDQFWHGYQDTWQKINRGNHLIFHNISSAQQHLSWSPSPLKMWVYPGAVLAWQDFRLAMGDPIGYQIGHGWSHWLHIATKQHCFSSICHCSIDFVPLSKSIFRLPFSPLYLAFLYVHMFAQVCVAPPPAVAILRLCPSPCVRNPELPKGSKRLGTPVLSRLDKQTAWWGGEWGRKTAGRDR